jgi:hypothetical protein
MIKAQIKIGSGSIVYTDEAYGLVYLDSDKRTAAPIKGFEKTAYPEEEGEHLLLETVDDAFDYNVKFFIQATSLVTANGKVKAFNDLILPLNQQTGKRTAAQVEFYNLCKRNKIVGYCEPMAEPKEFWRDPTNQVNDVVVVELTIHVPKPSLCDFNYQPSL